MLCRVYRNLNNGLWSIQQKIPGKSWQVVAHAESVTITGVTVHMSKSGQARARKEQKRNVHCMAQGTLESFTGAPYKGKPVHTTATPTKPTSAIVTYNPFVHDSLVYASGEREFTGAHTAQFTTDHKMLVS